MRRLAMTVLLAVVASALTGVLPPTGASGRTSPPPSAVVVAAVPARAPLPFRASRSIEEVPAASGGSRARSTDAIWAALARCESSGNPRAVGGGGRYFGAFQFTLSTWRSVGGTGNPAEHPYAVQLDAAKRLQARRGWSQWPACARRLGLR